MENEQLKQKASEYAKENSANLIEVEQAFLAGASFVSQNRDEEIEKLRNAFEIVYTLSDHGIPYYAIGDSEAASSLDSCMTEIGRICEQALQFIESKGGKK